jgi:hypothetical protein
LKLMFHLSKPNHTVTRCDRVVFHFNLIIKLKMTSSSLFIKLIYKIAVVTFLSSLPLYKSTGPTNTLV